MKRNLSKIFASSSIVVALILIMILIVTAFGGIQQDEFNSKLVRGLLITLTVLYMLLSVITLILLFLKTEIVKEVTIRLEKNGTIRVSTAVIGKLVRKACKQIEGVKCKKVTVTSDDYGVRLKISIKVVDKDVIEVEAFLRTLIEDMFIHEFGFRFNTIETKVMHLIPKYRADKEHIESVVSERLEEIGYEQDKLNEAAHQDIVSALSEEFEQVKEEEGEVKEDVGNLDSEDGVVEVQADTTDSVDEEKIEEEVKEAEEKIEIPEETEEIIEKQTEAESYEEYVEPVEEYSEDMQQDEAHIEEAPNDSAQGEENGEIKEEAEEEPHEEERPIVGDDASSDDEN